MELAKIVGNQTLIMFLLVAVGVLVRKLKFVTAEGSNQLNRILLMVVIPVVIVHSFDRPYDPELFEKFCSGFVLAAISMAVATVVTVLGIHGREEHRRIERLGAMLPNCGFIGIPLAMALLGDIGVIYASAYIVVMSLFQWTIGVILLVGRTDRKQTLKNMFLNPATISLVIGLIIFCGDIHLPAPVSTTLTYITDLNTPIAMIVLGVCVAQADLKHDFRNLRIYWSVVLRQVIAPLLMIPLYLLLPFHGEVVLANFVLAACPMALTPMAFPALFGMDKEYGASMVTVSTLLGIGTVPLMVLIMQQIIPY